MGVYQPQPGIPPEEQVKAIQRVLEELAIDAMNLCTAIRDSKPGDPLTRRRAVEQLRQRVQFKAETVLGIEDESTLALTPNPEEK